MKAKNREEFISAWEEEFDILAALSQSLPTAGKPNIAIEYLNKLRELRLRYIALAANDTYGARFCRFCEHMKDHADGETDAQGRGIYCELDLVKQETGDLTAATCEKYANWEILLARRKEQEAKGEISEEEHIEAAATALKTLSQVKGVTVSQESKPKRVKPMRLEMHKRQDSSQ